LRLYIRPTSLLIIFSSVVFNPGISINYLRTNLIAIVQVGVTTSCTIRLNDEVYCVRDGGEWKDCPHGSGVNDLVIAIEKLSRA
jgi:hypothetical protein